MVAVFVRVARGVATGRPEIAAVAVGCAVVTAGGGVDGVAVAALGVRLGLPQAARRETSKTSKSKTEDCSFIARHYRGF